MIHEDLHEKMLSIALRLIAQNTGINLKGTNRKKKMIAQSYDAVLSYSKKSTVKNI